MHKPDFPYLGNQAIISSGRAVVHAKDDMIFLFGKKGVGVSTPATFNVDAPESTIIASNIIQLGYQAMEPVLLGRSTVVQLETLLLALQQLTDALQKMSWVPEDLAAAVPAIQKSSKVLSGEIPIIINQLQNCLSQTTYTK